MNNIINSNLTVVGCINFEDWTDLLPHFLPLLLRLLARPGLGRRRRLGFALLAVGRVRAAAAAVLVAARRGGGGGEAAAAPVRCGRVVVPAVGVYRGGRPHLTVHQRGQLLDLDLHLLLVLFDEVHRALLELLFPSGAVFAGKLQQCLKRGMNYTCRSFKQTSSAMKARWTNVSNFELN